MSLKLLSIFISAFLAGHAFASKASLTSLLQDSRGSFYIDDIRNILLNPVDALKMDNQILIETGSTYDDTDTSIADGQYAEGAVVYGIDDAKLALFLGGAGELAEARDSGRSVVSGFVNPQDSFLVAYASGRMGYSLFYAAHERDTMDSADFPDNSAKELNVRVGMNLSRKISGYAYLNLMGESTNKTSASAENKFAPGLNAGMGAKMELSRRRIAYATLSKVNFTVENAAGTVDTEADSLALKAGLAHFFKKGNGVDIFIESALSYTATETKNNITSTSIKGSALTVPVILGTSVKLKKWMSLRASVGQNVLISQQKTTDGSNEVKLTNNNSTDTALGVSLHFGDLTMDAALGNENLGKIDGNYLLSELSIKYMY